VLGAHTLAQCVAMAAAARRATDGVTARAAAAALAEARVQALL